MKSRIFLIVFALIILSSFIFSAVYLYIYLDKKDTPIVNTEANIYKAEEKINLISNVEPFLFIQPKVKLVYEGGPVHWGSRTITFVDMIKINDNKIVNLHVIDQSDLKGEEPKKEWNQKWEATSDGSIYIDSILMLKSPIIVGNEWNIAEYSPIIDATKKYTTTVKITSVLNSLNNLNVEVKKVNTILTINDIKTIDGGIYTETRVFESGLGLSKVTATEPTIAELMLNYWLDSSIPIE